MDDELIDSLQAVPLWKTVPLDLPNSCLMINSNFVQKELTYNINAFDGSHFWQESVTKKDFLKKCKQSFAAAVGVQKEKIMEPEAPHLSRIVMTKANDFDKLMEQIRDKLSTVSSREKVQLLTLTPESWSIKEASSYFQELNPKIEANLDYIFNEIKTKCDELSCKEKFNVYKEQDDTALRILLKFKLSQEVPFSWRFDLAKMSNNSLIAQNMLLSLFSIIGELSKRQNELFSIIEKKDVEIQDMKDQGATPSRRNLETELFVSSTFLQQRFQSEAGVKEQDTDQEVTSNTSTQMTSLADEEGSTSTCLHQNSEIFKSVLISNLRHSKDEDLTRREIIEKKLAEKASGTRSKPKRKKINL
eukprot:gene14565-5637_t